MESIKDTSSDRYMKSWDKWGFITEDTDKSDLSPPSKRKAIHIRMTKQINDIISEGGVLVNNRKLKGLCRKGLPAAIRGNLWLKLSKVHTSWPLLLNSVID